MIESLLSFFAVDCGTSKFLGFPYWYSYLPDVANGNSCNPQLKSLSDVWLIVMAIIEILLRVAAIVAVIFVIYSGISYMTSQGDAEATGRAKGALVNALIGLAISVIAAAAVAFIAGSFN